MDIPIAIIILWIIAFIVGYFTGKRIDWGFRNEN
jgi:hypothetical protein